MIEETVRALKEYGATLTTLYGEVIDDSLFFKAAAIIESLAVKVEELDKLNKQLFSILSSRRICKNCNSYENCICQKKEIYNS